MPAATVVAIELVRRAVDEADVDVEIAVGIEIAPRRGSRLDVVGEADGGGDVDEATVILAVKTVRPAAKADELVQIAVVVVVGPRVRLTAGDAEQLWLDELEAWAGGGRGPRCGCRQHQRHG